MKTIGITGGIGSGKTTCCKIFESLGIPVYYADARAKRLMSFDKQLKKGIKDLLGYEAYHTNGRLNRKFVSSKIFNDKKLLQKINSLVHPAVGRNVITWASKQKNVPYVLYEAALLVENGSYKNFDKLIVVSCPEKIRIDRVMKRDKVSAEDVKARMKNQLPEQRKTEVADYIIENIELETIRPQVLRIHESINRM